MVLMSPSASLECVQGRVQPRDEDPIKRVEHPFPQSTSPKNVFPKVFQMKKKKMKKKKKKGFLVLMFGWLAGSNVPPFDVSCSQKNASPKNNSMYGFDVRLAWWVIKSRDWR
jgi:hypothetical protein